MNYKQVLRNTLLVLLGNLIFAIAINAVVIPNQLGEGGVTGLSLFFLYVLGWNNAVFTFIANSILMVIGWRYLDKKTILYTLLSIVSMSVFLQYVNIGEFVPENSIMAPVASGFLIGLAIGIVIHGNGTTAGTDILAMIMNKYLGISVSKSFLILDISIIIPLTMVIGLEKGLMTMGTMFFAAHILNYVLEGYNPRKSVTIISEHYEKIAEQLIEQLDRGVTVLNGYGFYTKKSKHIIYIVVNQRQVLKLQKIVKAIDPRAFVTIADIKQVYGEGFSFFNDSVENTSEMDQLDNIPVHEP